MVPVVAFSPKKYKSKVTITVIKIKGINTIIHDTTPKPLSHNIFNNKVIIIMTKNFTKAVLKYPLYKSIIT